MALRAITKFSLDVSRNSKKLFESGSMLIDEQVKYSESNVLVFDLLAGVTNAVVNPIELSEASYLYMETDVSLEVKFVPAGSRQKTVINTIPAGSLGIAGGEYFKVYSIGDNNQYYVWFTVAGVGVDPGSLPDLAGFIGILVPLGNGDAGTIVAQSIANQINAQASSNFKATASYATVTILSNTVGDSLVATTNAANGTVGATSGNLNFLVNTVMKASPLVLEAACAFQTIDAGIPILIPAFLDKVILSNATTIDGHITVVALSAV